MGAHLFKSSRELTIPGFKEQTIDKSYVQFDPDFVYVPLTRKNRPLQEMHQIGDYVARGTLLLVDDDGFPVYSSISGTIRERRDMLFADGVRPTFVIQNDHQGTFELRPPLRRASECTSEEILSAIRASGCVGFGGAGFPTYRKYQKECQYLIINAVECEPYLNSDLAMGAEHMDLAFKAIPYLLKVSGATKVFLAIKENKERLISAASDCKRRYADLPVEIVLVPDEYPMGYERNLVRHILNKEYESLPIEAGAIVNNLYTYIMLGETFLYGTVPVTRCYTVAGCVRNPQLVFSPAYVLSSDLIEFCGGKSTDEETILLDGGPMTAHTLQDDFVTSLETSGVLVLPNKPKRAEPCMHCGLCSNNCPMDLQPVQIQMALKAQDMKRMISLRADCCISCGLCSYVCPSHIDVSFNVKTAKERIREFRRAEKDKEKSDAGQD